MPRDATPDLTYNAALVLSALQQGSGYGLDVIERTDLSSGTVYPALRRLEAAGLVEGDWEEEARAHESGRPARRYYRITPEGREALTGALERLRARQRALGWAPDAGA
jgi:DNA-binding PadR family transcriptional regulator